ncbi:MAG TPA: tRNA (adenosine(37)-N6)-threonylcarbamoyltransferase complex transferase subunit TsaD [Brevefilum sp.]|nr:tRNA (adenosine(37)-N6)-threonylcarbamoyltransferase complex transferase subunit TsaD [Brevefilum sp.]HOR19152.1 tRNA (adenosine(37)-N6)-threonylcarbamoyltransferase complex transferase subunit TsaD [Brevefilum sp.]HPL69628.1 tRNA (adenosine(37)-N6)-threonylcarbamoyltransferase complex transferase subunit TsaD [Brevefilum sp.]
MALPPARILGIETSCDETAAAVISNGRVIESNVVASQVDLHAQYGGVFPELASREHVKAIHPIVNKALRQAHVDISEIDAIAVTQGPGLAGSLVVGVNMAKGLALVAEKPLIGINHLEGHIYSAWLHPGDVTPPQPPRFPLLALLVSGGHSELILMTDHLAYQRLGGTLDDAAGEALDKVARLLDLPYPGGPSIQKVSASGKETAFSFPKAMLEGSWDFSFSGVKTAVLRAVEALQAEGRPLPIEDLAASFQAAVVDVLVEKTLHAAQKYKVREIIVAGGVSANKRLREKILAESKYPVHIPPLALCTDNAAMIAAAGYFHFIKEDFSPFDIDVLPNWPLSFSH